MSSRYSVYLLLALTIWIVSFENLAEAQNYRITDEFNIHEEIGAPTHLACGAYLNLKVTDVTVARSGRRLGVLQNTSTPATEIVAVYGRTDVTTSPPIGYPCNPTQAVETYFKDLNNDGTYGPNEPVVAKKVRCDDTASTPKAYFLVLGGAPGSGTWYCGE